MDILITGGCGFIGSHLADKLLLENHKIMVIDKEETYKNSKADYARKDIVRDDILGYFNGVDAVFHLAADPMVNSSAVEPKISFNENVIGTFNVLETCRKNDVRHIVFTSTSTVYGKAKTIPTREDYPCKPISNYGASKLANEGYISSYCNSYGIKGTILRLANIYGERSTHGVMHDFYDKLKIDKKKLEILGNGAQDKSYLYISDCIEAIVAAWKKQRELVDYFNVGSDSKITVNEIAKLMSRELGLNPALSYTGGDGGWVGDVPLMLLDCSKLKKLGWIEKISFVDGLKRYITWMNRV